MKNRDGDISGYTIRLINLLCMKKKRIIKPMLTNQSAPKNVHIPQGSNSLFTYYLEAH